MDEQNKSPEPIYPEIIQPLEQTARDVAQGAAVTADTVLNVVETVEKNLAARIKEGMADDHPFRRGLDNIGQVNDG